MIDAEWPCVPFVSRIYGINPSQAIWNATLRHADDLTPELERVSEAIKDAKLRTGLWPSVPIRRR